MQELLSALKGLGSSEGSEAKQQVSAKQEKDEVCSKNFLTFVQYYSSFTYLFQLSSSESVKTPEPFFGEVPSVKERASTMPVIPSAESAVTENSAHQPPTQLRVHTNSTRDPNWRKSGTVIFSSPLLLL